jgi:hypothetical protein
VCRHTVISAANGMPAAGSTSKTLNIASVSILVSQR